MNKKDDGFGYFMGGFITACVVGMFLALIIQRVTLNSEITDAEYFAAQAMADEYPAVRELFENSLENGVISGWQYDRIIDTWYRERNRAKYVGAEQ